MNNSAQTKRRRISNSRHITLITWNRSLDSELRDSLVNYFNNLVPRSTNNTKVGTIESVITDKYRDNIEYSQTTPPNYTVSTPHQLLYTPLSIISTYTSNINNKTHAIYLRNKVLKKNLSTNWKSHNYLT